MCHMKVGFENLNFYEVTLKVSFALYFCMR